MLRAVTSPRSLLRRFITETRAAVAFETVLITPLLIWAFIGSFVFFDAFRIYNSSIKATHMVADMLSRQTSTVFGHDIQGMASIVEYVLRDAGEIELRVTQIGMVSGNYQIDWSHGVNGAAQMFDVNLAALEGQLPNMANGERILLVETFINYDAPFDIGLQVLRFENFTLTRPRYAGQVPFQATGTPAGS